MLNRDYDTYTLTLHDALLDYPTLLDGLVLDTTEHTNTFLRVFKARWDIYEIAGETIPLEKRYIENRFNVVKDYYIELINAYETKINMLDGKKTSVVTDRTESTEVNTSTSVTANGTTSDTISATGNTDDKHIDLPNKVVTTSETSKYLSSEDVGTSSSSSTSNGTTSDTTSSTGENTGSKDVDMTITTTGGVNVIELKKDYMDLLRNVYEDFANDFKRCFLYIYGVM